MALVMDPAAKRPLRGAPVAVLDFETTGPDPRSCVPVQVAVAHYLLGDSEPDVVYASLINPGVPIPEGATAVHHITDEAVKDAPTWTEALEPLLHALEGRVLVAFNLPFDWQILARGVVASGRSLSELPFGGLDPLVWAKVAHRYQKGKKLVDVAARYNVPIDAHDASGDVLATARVMPKLLHDLGRHQECGRDPLLSVGAMWAWTLRNALAEDRGYAAWCRTQGRLDPILYWEELSSNAWIPGP